MRSAYHLCINLDLRADSGHRQHESIKSFCQRHQAYDIKESKKINDLGQML
jgi:hypothetical protein